ncbi:MULTISPECIES: helix-turn-helix domain-containing protein [Shouchella]|uniref:XRE family transcriptional regulator n=2 Tax=Shouchella TaxID=2893057 RepID=A0ABY7W1E9_9BACI|nr:MULTISPECIES: XRE family transcriptional regulator [Shouchella]MED4129678.1 XRE family transcriptional regulator [Shouchella miscanthi]WDF02259.1 XRE family transcriptional regulator [Shouchella hunanensis]
MEEKVAQQIGERVRQLRMKQGYSLEAFANRINVSKLTLMKVEKGEGNPTLSVVWKIANGLSVPIASLLMVEEGVELSRKKQSLELASSDNQFIVEPMFQKNHYELYRGYLKPGAIYQSDAHPKGVNECITVMTNELIVRIEDEAYHLQEHDAIRFSGDKIHLYENPTDQLTVLHFVISYEG